MEFNQEYTNYQLRRSVLRKFIRRLYMRHAAKYVRGSALDFGCGVGDLLQLLPEGSMGLEVNEATVQYTQSIGLPVELYNLEVDRYQFQCVRNSNFKTFIISHVLEHLENPDEIFQTILQSTERLGIERVILVVPGLKGFHRDTTHKTFINIDYLRAKNLFPPSGFSITTLEYFPFNFSWMGRFFTHNELFLVYDRQS